MRGAGEGRGLAQVFVSFGFGIMAQAILSHTSLAQAMLAQVFVSFEFGIVCVSAEEPRDECFSTMYTCNTNLELHTTVANLEL